MKHGILSVSTGAGFLPSFKYISWIQFPSVTPEFFRCQELVTMLLQARCPLEVPVLLGRNADGPVIPDPLQAHSKKGETPLIWAAMQQQLDCMKVLIAARANLNAQVEGDSMGKLGQILRKHEKTDSRPNHSVKIWKSVQGRKWAESSWPCRRDLKQQGNGLCSDAHREGLSFGFWTVWRSWRCSGKPWERHHKSGAECTDATHGVKQPVGLTRPYHMGTGKEHMQQSVQPRGRTEPSTVMVMSVFKFEVRKYIL